MTGKKNYFAKYFIRHPGFGFLSFEDDEAVDRCVSEHFVNLNGKQVFENRILNVTSLYIML